MFAKVALPNQPTNITRKRNVTYCYYYKIDVNFVLLSNWGYVTGNIGDNDLIKLTLNSLYSTYSFLDFRMRKVMMIDDGFWGGWKGAIYHFHHDNEPDRESVSFCVLIWLSVKRYSKAILLYTASGSTKFCLSEN